MKCHIRTCAILCILTVMPPVLAAPGDLDPTFGNAGRVIFDDTGDDNWPAGGGLLPDGRILVGRGNSSAADDFSVLRFHADGSVDSSFDHDGRTSLDIPGIKGETHSVFLQPDGKVIVVGWIREGENLAQRLGLARYLADGSLDSSFGNNGWVRSEATFQGLSLSAVLQPDGRLVIAGHAYPAGWSGSDIAMARFNPDGSLDHSFGQNGYAYTESNAFEWMSQLVRQPDGKLLLFMDVEASSPKAWYDWQATIMRFEPDGQPDQTFGVGGRAPLLNETSFSSGLALADGRILAALASDPYPWDIAYCGALLTRVQPDGRLDESFGTDGVSQQPFDGCQTFGPSMLIDPQGAILINGGRTTNWPGAMVIDSFDHVVTRVNSSGELDRSFGRDGQAVLDVGDGDYLPYVGWGGSLLRQDDGKLVILASGIRALTSSGPNTRLVLARLQTSGGSPGLIGIKSVESTVVESDGHIDVRVRRSGGSAGLVSVDYSTTSGSASDNADFIPVAGTLTWADGDREDKTITIEVISDTVTESREQFTLMLSNVAGGAGLATSRIPISIVRPLGEIPTTPPAVNSSGGGGAMSWEFLLAIALVVLALNRRAAISR